MAAVSAWTAMMFCLSSVAIVTTAVAVVTDGDDWWWSLVYTALEQTHCAFVACDSI